jgi:hypothetical protein
MIEKALKESINIFEETEDSFYQMSQTNIDIETAYAYIIKSFGEPDNMNWQQPSKTDLSKQPKRVSEILKLYLGGAKGSNFITSQNTPWGLFNAVTEFSQHYGRKTKNSSVATNSLLFGSKSALARKAFTELSELTTDINRSYIRQNQNQVTVSI